MSFTVGVVCDIGAGPAHGGRQRNEDNFLVCFDNHVLYDSGGVRKPVPQAGEGLLLAVCDGMGGHADGHVASMTAVKVLARLYQPSAPTKPERVLLRYVLETHQQLHDAALAEIATGTPRGGPPDVTVEGPTLMGTKLTAVWILGRSAAWVQVGDSRLYHYRAGRLVRITADHTRNEFARRDGKAERPDGDVLAQNYIYGSRGLGDNRALRLEAGRDNGVIALEPGDRLLLCTDGVTNVLSDAHIAGILRDFEEPAVANNELRVLAVEAGSLDNLTAVIVRMDDAADWLDDDDTETEITAAPRSPPRSGARDPRRF